MLRLKSYSNIVIGENKAGWVDTDPFRHERRLRDQIYITIWRAFYVEH